MCRAKQKSRQNSVALVSDGDEPDDDETLVLLGVYSADAEITYVSGCKGIIVKITMGSEIVPSQLDTGAAVSIVPERLVCCIGSITVNVRALRNGMKLFRMFTAEKCTTSRTTHSMALGHPAGMTDNAC